jgi:hypothetical protein
MLEVTERAIGQLAQMRTEVGLGPDQGLGIVPQGDGEMQLAPMQPGPTDQVIRQADEPVMVIPAALADPLDGLVLDCIVGAGGRQFTLTRPEDGGQGVPAGAGTGA